MRVLSLFSGIGAFEKALKNIGVRVELVGFSEIDKYAIKSYCAVHGVDERLNLGDITKINKIKELGEIDLICHGSPCTTFSIAGKQTGGDEGSGTASSLMWYSVNIIKKVKPKYIIWENVKNVLSPKHIHNFNKYLDTLSEPESESGYNNYYKVLNAKDYGVPQNRERIFVVSIRKDVDKGFAFPEKEELKLRLRDMLEPEEEIDERYYLRDEIVNKIDTFIQQGKEPKCVQVATLDIKGIDQIKRVYSPEGLCPTITTMTGGNRQPKIAISNTVNKDSDVKVRKLTPREVWRLMSFSDEDYEKAKNAGISSSQLYKQAGNSIVVKVLEKVFTELILKEVAYK